MPSASGSLPLEEIADDLARVTGAVADLAENESLENILDGVDSFINDAELQALAGSVDATLVEIRSSMSGLQKLVASVDAKVDPVADGAVAALAEVSSALGEIEQLVAAVRGDLGGESEARYAVYRTLREVERAARAFRLFVELLEEQPEALVEREN